MRLLLDTHALLWWLADDARLGPGARGIIAEPANAVPDETRRQGFDLLPIEPAHLLALRDLPRHHGDPWDHLLVAQAEGAVLMSEDARVALYPAERVGCPG